MNASETVTTATIDADFVPEVEIGSAMVRALGWALTDPTTAPTPPTTPTQ